MPKQITPSPTELEPRSPAARRNAKKGIVSPEDVRGRLLAAAGPIFANRGFDGATIRELCRAANANVAAIGYHFGDKMGLYLEVVRDIRQRRECEFPLPDDDYLPPEARLRHRIHLLLSRLLLVDEEQSWETQLLMREMQSPTAAFTEMIQQSFRPYFDQLCQILTVISDSNISAIALNRLVFSVIGQCLYYRVGNQTIKALVQPNEISEHFNIGSLTEHITRVTLAAAKSDPIS